MLHPVARSDRVSYSQFCESLALAKQRFAEIQQRYPALRAYLVISSPFGQADVDPNVSSLLASFPALFVDSAKKDRALSILRELKATKGKLQSLSNSAPDYAETKSALSIRQENLKTRLQQVADSLLIDGQCFYELRFHDLDYPLISQLQTDPLVDRALTPQTRASIRIVVGSISSFWPPTSSTTTSSKP